VTDHLAVGGQLGSYLIDSVIGRGGMSVVYGARHARLGMPVALKVLAPELSMDDTFRERFLREAQIAAGIDHPNVIPIHDMGLQENSLYIVMRYVSGGDLKTLVSNSGPLELDRSLALLTPVGLALDTAHAHGLVHRDVKPANILIQRSGAEDLEHVYLTDFGIAKSAAFSGALTAAGASIGTIGYMAPEQIECHEVSAQTDVYALAVTFYECLTGRVPFQRELAEGIRPPTGAVDPVSRVQPDVPTELDGVIATALSRDPAARYRTCAQFLQACTGAIETGSSRTGEASTEGTAAGGLPTTELSEPPATVAASTHEPSAARGAEPPAPPGGSPPPAPPGESRPSAPPGESPPPQPPRGRRGALATVANRPYAALLVALAAGAAVAVILLTSNSGTQSGQLAAAPLPPVPTNHVTGSGEVTVRLHGNQAAVTVTTQGLDNGAALVHAMHIHAGAKGQCPPASAARLHNGHLSISTTDGINYYGPPVQALTTSGDTSPASILAFRRYLTGGTLDYTRTITLTATVAEQVRDDNAVIVVHGIDYDGSGIYSGVLDRSELSKSVPGTATAPALCGHLVARQTAAGMGRRTRGLVYSAQITGTDVQGAPGPGSFVCHAPEAALAVTETRRGARSNSRRQVT
jgi:serine/threonine protein kinase